MVTPVLTWTDLPCGCSRAVRPDRAFWLVRFNCYVHELLIPPDSTPDRATDLYGPLEVTWPSGRFLPTG